MFDIAELREVTAYDELELDTLGDRRTALFLIMSDTDDSFNFLISMCYTQLFNLLCEKADDVYGGRLPVHVRCLIDEAANIGQIPRLEKLVATIVNSGEVDALVTVTTGELVATSTSGSWGTGISVDGSGVVTNNGATQDQTEELFTITLYYNATEDSAEDAKALSTSQNVVAETGVIYIYAEVTWTSDDLATNATAAYADALDTWVGENVASVGCTLTYSAVQNSTRPTT